MENEANAANVKELHVHIDRTTAKLDAMPTSAPAYAETKELLEDYYERLLQIRDMSQATLQQRMADEEARHHAAEMALASGKQRFAGLAAVLAVLLAVVAETAHTGAVSGPLVSTTLMLYNSTPALMIATGFIVHILTKRRW